MERRVGAVKRVCTLLYFVVVVDDDDECSRLFRDDTAARVASSRAPTCAAAAEYSIRWVSSFAYAAPYSSPTDETRFLYQKIERLGECTQPYCDQRSLRCPATPPARKSHTSLRRRTRRATRRELARLHGRSRSVMNTSSQSAFKEVHSCRRCGASIDVARREPSTCVSCAPRTRQRPVVVVVTSTAPQTTTIGRRRRRAPTPGATTERDRRPSDRATTDDRARPTTDDRRPTSVRRSPHPSLVHDERPIVNTARVIPTHELVGHECSGSAGRLVFTAVGFHPRDTDARASEDDAREDDACATLASI